MVASLKFRNGQVNSSHTLLGMRLLIHAGMLMKGATGVIVCNMHCSVWHMVISNYSLDGFNNRNY